MRTLALTFAMALSACGGKNPGAYTAPAAAPTAEEAAIDSAVAAADEMWEARGDAAKLHAALQAYEAVLELDPGNRQALTRLTRGWYFYGDAFSDDKDEKIERWGNAIEYGKRCLALNSDFASRIEAGEKEKDAVVAATESDVPCLYWTASALGKWGKIQGLARTLRHLPTVKAYIGRAEELNPTFYHYGPARYWGAYYAVLPSFAGQDLERSAEYFAASIEGAPNYLGTRVLRAEMLAVATEDVALFDSDLQYVLDADANVAGRIAPENTQEQEKARRLIEQRSELFGRRAIEAADGGTE